MIIITAEPFQPTKLLTQLDSNSEQCGAVVSFTGKMREEGESGRPLSALYLEH